MSIESSYLSREGFGELTKITSFIRSIIVKNGTEAAKYETKDSAYNYMKYSSAYSDAKNPYDFHWSYKELQMFFHDDYIKKFNLTTQDGMNKALLTSYLKDTAEKFMTYLQNKELENYYEANQYYRSFLGLPPTDADIIMVKNLDYNPEIHKPELEHVPIHSLKLDYMPLTYEFYIIKENIRYIIADFPDLDYLKFINNKKSPYFIRECPDFTIMYCDRNILSSEEYNRFMKAYTRAQNYINEVLYLVGMNDRYPLYSNLMYLMILFYTFQMYMNLRIKDYSLGKYTDFDLYDILDSNGLSKLKKISDKKLLRKVVKHLDLLQEYKGSETVLNILFDLIADDTITVKRSELIKEYPTDLTKTLLFDTTKTYDKQVDLKFREKVLISAETNLSAQVETYVDYDTHIEKDKIWGCSSDIEDLDVRRATKESLKRKILSMEFSSIPTKYINLAKSLNIFKSSGDVTNLLYLIFQFCEEEEASGNNPMVIDRIIMDESGNEVQPVVLFAGICYFHGWASGLSDPEIISSDRTMLTNINIVRNKNGVIPILEEAKTKEISILDGVFTIPLSTLLKGKVIENFLIKYNLDMGTSLLTIVDEYGDNTAMMNELGSLVYEQADDEFVYEAWLYLYKKNKSDYDFSKLFQGYTNYVEFIKMKNSWFYYKIEEILAQISNFEDSKEIMLTVGKHAIEWMKKLQEYFTKLIDSRYTISFALSDSDVRYLDDLKILLDSFLSIYCELYNMEYETDLSDAPFNNIKLRYSQIENLMQNDLSYRLNTFYNKTLDVLRSAGEDEIGFDYSTIHTMYEGFKAELQMEYSTIYDYLEEAFLYRLDLVMETLENISIEDYDYELKLGQFIEELEEIVDTFFEDELINLSYIGIIDELYNTDEDTIKIKFVKDSDIFVEEYTDDINFKKHKIKG